MNLKHCGQCVGSFSIDRNDGRPGPQTRLYGQLRFALQLRRWRGRYEEYGYDGRFDRRRGKPSPKRVRLAPEERTAPPSSVD